MVIEGGRLRLKPAFHIVGERGVVALDTRRTQTLQHVEDVLELEKNRRWRAALKPEATQVLQFGHHVH